MCEERLCLHLLNSLDAAFRGIPAGESDLVSSWGLEVMEVLKYSCLGSNHPQILIRQIALDLLLGISSECPCDGLAEGVLHSPERFLKGVMALANQPPCVQPPAPGVIH